MNVIVTGANGQLGMCIKDCVSWMNRENITYYFYGHRELNIAKEDDINYIFERVKPDVVINCAAYTNVDEAEEPKNYVKVAEANTKGPELLVKYCEIYDAALIHISTDYVFNGDTNTPYKEPAKGEDITCMASPLNYYGVTKMHGDYAVSKYRKGIIIRTSWLYSEYGNNIYRTFLNRVKSRQDIKALSNRLSCPTYARDLANFIVYSLVRKNVLSDEKVYGVFNYCNEGVASVYDFALAIETLYESYYKVYEPVRGGNEFSFELHRNFVVQPVKEYKAKAKRPDYSVLDCTKVKETFGVKIKGWIASLTQCMQNDGAIKIH